MTPSASSSHSLLARIGRIWRHRWTDEADLRRALPADLLDRLTSRVASSERLHSGEIRICVEAGLPLPYLWRGASARERALALFGKLRVWDTEHNNGILIYLLLAEHAIEIVADRGINCRVEDPQWAVLAHRMGSALRNGYFEDGLTQAIDEVTKLLIAHFPLTEGQVPCNELPDEALLL